MNDYIYLCWQCYIAGVSLSMYVGQNKSYASMSVLGGNFGAGVQSDGAENFLLFIENRSDNWKGGMSVQASSHDWYERQKCCI